MGRRRTLVMLFAAAVAAGAAVRHTRGASRPRSVPGGTLMGDAAAYDALTRLVFGSLLDRIAGDIAAAAPDRARVLEVGCGPGHLAIRLARRHGLDVTGVDLDEAMIERARANADRAGEDGGQRPSFLVGDVASLAFPDGSFDLAVSTFSLHHWADPTAGLAEIGRVLRRDATVLLWDVRPGVLPFHPHVPDPVEHAQGTPLRLVSATRWRWPWRFNLAQRFELTRINVDGPGQA